MKFQLGNISENYLVYIIHYALSTSRLICSKVLQHVSLAPPKLWLSVFDVDFVCSFSFFVLETKFSFDVFHFFRYYSSYYGNNLNLSAKDIVEETFLSWLEVFILFKTYWITSNILEECKSWRNIVIALFL